MRILRIIPKQIQKSVIELLESPAVQRSIFEFLWVYPSSRKEDYEVATSPKIPIRIK